MASPAPIRLDDDKCFNTVQIRDCGVRLVERNTGEGDPSIRYHLGMCVMSRQAESEPYPRPASSSWKTLLGSHAGKHVLARVEFG